MDQPAGTEPRPQPLRRPGQSHRPRSDNAVRRLLAVGLRRPRQKRPHPRPVHRDQDDMDLTATADVSQHLWSDTGRGRLGHAPLRAAPPAAPHRSRLSFRISSSRGSPAGPAVAVGDEAVHRRGRLQGGIPALWASRPPQTSRRSGRPRVAVGVEAPCGYGRRRRTRYCTCVTKGDSTTCIGSSSTAFSKPADSRLPPPRTSGRSRS